jgi:hypothetical protein
VDSQLRTLIDLQALDARIAALEAEAARLPRQIETIQQALTEAKRTVDALRAKQDQTKKDLRTKEKDLEVTAAKRSKAEAKLYEVKTNKEYSAMLVEIEDIKQEKARTEEEILNLMELQERLVVDVREAEARHKTREEQARQDESVIRTKLAAVEAELATGRAARESRARELPRGLLTDYEKLLRARAGLAVAAVTAASICGGCRVAIRPQAIQELRAATAPMICESCGRYLYWQE